MYGNPDQIDALAREVRDHAERADEQSHRVRDLGRTLPWTGAAGDGFRIRMARRATACAGVRDDLLAAATALEHHGDEVRALLAEIARLQVAIADWVGSAVDVATDLAKRAGEAAGDVAGAVLEVDSYLPWKGWDFDPRLTPPPGHQGWLELGRKIGAQGVTL